MDGIVEPLSSKNDIERIEQYLAKHNKRNLLI